MQAVYKYPIPVEDHFTLDLPLDARLLKCECQGGAPFLWALVAPKAKTEPRRFRLAGTGHHIEDAHRLDHVSTFQMAGGALIFHLFVERV